MSLAKLSNHWRWTFVWLLLITLGHILLFMDTWGSIEKIWSSSQTFAHGYLVAPMSIWLASTQWTQIKHLSPKSTYIAITVIPLFGLLWLSADLINVLVVKQFAVVLLLICAYVALLGIEISKAISFPLFFLLMLVPFGEDFVPYLMEFTASFTVAMLRITGVSVFREGLHFSLSSGEWSVVEACSGIRYLIASITLGCVFAYLNFVSFKKRSLFMLAAVLIPIIANGFRAYMIVMIGHLSNMALATGVDHIIYGWLFFGLVMAILFYVGSLWRDDIPSQNSADSVALVFKDIDYKSHAIPCLILLFLGLAVWPVFSIRLKESQPNEATWPTSINFDGLQESFQNRDWGWQPEFIGAKLQILKFFKVAGREIGFYAANFGDESDGGELINSQNQLLRKQDDRWRVVESSRQTLSLGEYEIPAEKTVLRSQDKDLYVLRWYRVGKVDTVNPYYAKLLQLFKRLTADSSPEVVMILYTEALQGDYYDARKALEIAVATCCEINRL